MNTLKNGSRGTEPAGARRPTSGGQPLFGENDADGGLVLLRAGLEPHNVSAEAQVAVGAALCARGLHQYLELRLQPRAVGEVDERALQGEVADHGLFLKGAAFLSVAGHPGVEAPLASQAVASRGHNHLDALFTKR